MSKKVKNNPEQSLNAVINKAAQDFDLASARSIDGAVDTLSALADVFAAPLLAQDRSSASEKIAPPECVSALVNS